MDGCPNKYEIRFGNFSIHSRLKNEKKINIFKKISFFSSFHIDYSMFLISLLAHEFFISYFSPLYNFLKPSWHFSSTLRSLHFNFYKVVSYFCRCNFLKCVFICIFCCTIGYFLVQKISMMQTTLEIEMRIHIFREDFNFSN